MNDIEIEAKSASKEEFIAKYMVDRGEIRWIRSIFFDEKDKIEAILDCMDRMTQKHEEEKAAMVREIHQEVMDTIDFYEKRSGSVITPVFTDVNTDIRTIATKHNVDLSKTDVIE